MATLLKLVNKTAGQTLVSSSMPAILGKHTHLRSDRQKPPRAAQLTNWLLPQIFRGALSPHLLYIRKLFATMKKIK